MACSRAAREAASCRRPAAADWFIPVKLAFGSHHPLAAESKQVRRHRFFHLSASLADYKVRSQAHSPPCNPFPTPATQPPSDVGELVPLDHSGEKSAPPVLLAGAPSTPG